MRKKPVPKFISRLLFWLVCLRDTVFYIAISVFPMAFILMKVKSLTWYELSGYIYGLVAPALIVLIKGRRSSGVGTLVNMIKILLLLSTFVMILLNGKGDKVFLNEISIAFFAAVFVCVYYEVHSEKTRENKARLMSVQK
ncbi:MAG: hypothetical protein LBS82_02465 [Spirochaetaceae bacterium]|jgi:hypothetical protein|nr:hypothetical protein [Spirochaetaceae bacterium]